MASIKSLRSIIAIAEHGTFALAADSVHISHSALSMQIRELEASLRTTLFDRTKRPPVLNMRGRRLVEHARSVVALYDQLGAAVSDPADMAGSLVIGTIPTASTGILPWALKSMRDHYPRLHVRIMVDMVDELLGKLEHNEVDVALIAMSEQPMDDFVWRPFATEKFVVLAPRSAKEKTAHDLLASYPYIRFSRRTRTGRMIEGYLRQQKISVHPVTEFDTLEGIGVMVYSGLGVSIVPRRIIGYPVPVPLKRVALPEPAPSRVLGLVERADNLKGALVQGLFRELEHLSKLAIQSAAGTGGKIPAKQKALFFSGEM